MDPAGGDATDWEKRWRAGDTPWDKSAASPPLLEWLAAHPSLGRALVPGCGSGHDVRALARSGMEPVGLDISPTAIRAAEAHPCAGSESYRRADFLELPPEMIRSFDWVVEHTCFCAIPRAHRARYADAVAASLSPGGQFLAVFYLDPGDDSPTPPFGVSRDELDALFSDRFELIGEFVPLASFPGREGSELVRHYRLR